MSAGPFTRSKYQADDLDIHPVRIQPETLLAEFNTTVNIAPSGAIDAQGAASVSRGRRAYGLHCRFVTVVFETSPPAGYLAGSPLRIPILVRSIYEGINVGDTVEYQGGTGGVVISKTPELFR